MAPMTHAFAKAMDDFIKAQKIPVVRFLKGQRKDEVAGEYLKQFHQEEGILFIGKAQEKVSVFRTEKRRNPVTGQSYPWIVRSTALVNQYYIYAVDGDFGPFFLKFSSYFPYNARLCINGHEYAKRQLTRLAFAALDNGFLTCADPAQCRRSVTGCRQNGSMACCANGWLACPIRSRLRTVAPATGMTSRFYRRNSRSPKSWTVPSRVASCLRTSSVKTWTWGVRTRCNSSLRGV